MVKKTKELKCTVHIHLKKPFKSSKHAREFKEKLKKYFDKEARIINLEKSKVGSVVPPLIGEYLSYGVARDFVDIEIGLADQVKSINEFDNMLNKGMSFLDLSESGVDGIMVTTSKTYEIKKAPLKNFFEKQALTDFSTQVKKQFNPKGMVLTTGILKGPYSDETELSIMFSSDEGIDEIDIIMQTRVKKKLLWDILSTNNKTINESKQEIFTTLGIIEK